MTVDRRSFIRTVAMGAATAAAFGSDRTARSVPLPLLDSKLTWRKAPCRFCGTGCHVLVGVENDRVVAIQGDMKADVNKGLLCVKGYHVGSILYGPDRLTRPLARKHGQLVPVSWEEAIDIVARRINANPAGFAYYGSGQWTIPEGYAANKFMKGGLGNNHIDPNARLCMASAVTGFLATYGVDEPAGCYDDLDAVRHRGLRWPVVEQPDGTWRETRFRFSGFDDPYVADGREFQFYHSTTNDDRAQIWFRPYEAPPETPDAAYPLWLSTGRVLEHWHSGTMTRRVPQLDRAMPGAYVEINRNDARRLGIRSGEKVVLESKRGGIELPAWIGGRGEPPEGSVFVPFFDEGLLINALTLDAYDPFSKQPDYKKCAVRVRKLSAEGS